MMPPERPKPVAVVTGAARGIGTAIAARLVADGHAVAGLDVSDDVVARLQAVGGSGWVADVSDAQAIDEVFADIGERLGPALILVNNAGVTTNIASVRKMPPEDWRRELEINLTGSFLCTRAALPAMETANYGRIVNIASIAASMGLDRQAAYAASKAGMLGLTKSVTVEQAGRDVTCNAVLPGLIATEKVDQMPIALKDKLRTFIPARRFGEPDEIAALVAFLVSADGGYINGAEIAIDGGYACNPMSLARLGS